MMSQIFGKKILLIWFKKLSSVKKLPINNDETFLDSVFDQN